MALLKYNNLTGTSFLNGLQKIAEPYVGKDNAESYGNRNSTEGELLVRIKSLNIVAEKNIAVWD